MRIMLSGTQISNGNPEDLMSALYVTDRLVDVIRAAGGKIYGDPRDPKNLKKAFRYTFMRYDEAAQKWVADLNRMPVLNDALRATCYIRREKSQVLTDLPALRRDTIELNLNGDLRKYRQAEEDMVRFLVEHGGEDALEGYYRAEVLVRMGTLKRLAGEAKINEAIAWVDDFLASRPDAQLVIFATHKSVQHGLVEHLEEKGIKTVHINTGKGATDEGGPVDRFQKGEVQVAVCSLAAAREGITMTAADTLLMVEQGWTPMEADQAEARIHRPGQNADHTEVVSLLAADTFDEDLFAIIGKKRTVEALALRGEISEDQDEESVTRQVITKMMERHGR